MSRIALLTTVFGMLFSPCGCRAEPPKSLIDPKTAIDFRLAMPIDAGECDGCTSFTYEGIFGKAERVLARLEPDLILEPEKIAGLTAWKAPDGFHIAVIASEEGAAMLAALADSASHPQMILVSAAHHQLGIFSPSLMKVSHGTLGFTFAGEHYFSQALRALGVDQSAVTESSDEDLLEACSQISDPVARARCRRTTWTAIQGEKESLQRAEKLLESGSPKDRDAAIEELLKD